MCVSYLAGHANDSYDVAYLILESKGNHNKRSDTSVWHSHILHQALGKHFRKSKVSMKDCKLTSASFCAVISALRSLSAFSFYSLAHVAGSLFEAMVSPHNVASYGKVCFGSLATFDKL